jgi:hypothetical protein
LSPDVPIVLIILTTHVSCYNLDSICLIFEERIGEEKNWGLRPGMRGIPNPENPLVHA